MRIDYDYLKDEIFPKFLDADTPAINFAKSFEHLWNDDATLGKLQFHMDLLDDQGFISTNAQSI